MSSFISNNKHNMKNTISKIKNAFQKLCTTDKCDPPTAKTHSEKPKNNIYSDLPVDSCSFADLGTAKMIELDNGHRLRHGTSDQLVKSASRLIKREFKMDSKKDMRRYRRKSKVTYYAVIETPTGNEGEFQVDCALRCILDDINHPTEVLIDFIRTHKRAQGKGLGTILVNFVIQGCAALGADLYVTSTKEALSYWKRFGLERESNSDIDDELNEFKDCKLLALPSNKRTKYSSEDLSTSEDSHAFLNSDKHEYISSDSDYVYYYEYASTSTSDSDSDSSTDSSTDSDSSSSD